MRQLGKNGGLALLLDGFLRIFLERSGHGICVLRFEKHKIAILTFYFEGSKVDSVFSGNFGERTDVFIGYLHTLHPFILGSKLFDGHSAVERLALLSGFHLLKKLGKCFSQFLFRQLCAVNYEGNHPLLNFFLRGASLSFPGICREKVRTVREEPPTDVKG